MPLTGEEAKQRLNGMAQRGEKVYEENLRSLLEPTCNGQFLAPEPDSGRYFLGPTAISAMDAAHEAMPEDVFYLMRVGGKPAHKFGVLRFRGRKNNSGGA